MLIVEGLRMLRTLGASRDGERQNGPGATQHGLRKTADSGAGSISGHTKQIPRALRSRYTHDMSWDLTSLKLAAAALETSASQVLVPADPPTWQSLLSSEPSKSDQEQTQRDVRLVAAVKRYEGVEDTETGESK